MRIDRVELKRRAKGMLSAASPSPIRVTLIYLAISLLFSLLSARLLGLSLTQNDIEQILTHMQNGHYEYAMEYMTEYMPPASSYIIDAALQIASCIVSAGFTIFILNTVRGAGACFGNLLDGFGMFWRVLWLSILKWIFTSLWSLLLFVPGIIAAYSYRMALYILIDHPEMSVMECIRESKRMMKGHKGELFMLDLSFFGWMFLSSLAAIGWCVSIFTTPYFALTYAQYYEILAGHTAGSYTDAI